MRYGWLALLCVWATVFFAPEPAHAAYNFSSPVLLGPPDPVTGVREVCPGSGLVRRLMPCLKETILTAVNNVLVPYSAYMATTIAAACVLAVTFLGFGLISAKQTAPMRDTLVTIVKVGAVSMFAANFTFLFSAALEITDGLLSIVTQYLLVSAFFGTPGQAPLIFGMNPLCPTYGDLGSYLVWDAVDCTINSLIGGILSGTNMALGIMGFFVACLFSTALGFMIGLVGIYIIIQVLFAVARAMYMLLSAYLGIAVMMLVFPLFLPLILFQATKSYFFKWLRLIMNFIIQPMFLFAYLSLLIAAFNTVMYSGPNAVFRVICGDSNVNNPLFFVPKEMGGLGGIGWCLLDRGGYDVSELGGRAVNVNPRPSLRPTEPDQTGLGDELPAVRFGREDPNAPTTSIWHQLGVAGTGVANFFKAWVPATSIDWWWMAAHNNIYNQDGWPDSIGMMIKLLISLVMAFIIAHIFMSMLDLIPYIGQGISNFNVAPAETLAQQAFGMGKMAPPGNNFIRDLSQRFRRPPPRDVP